MMRLIYSYGVLPLMMALAGLTALGHRRLRRNLRGRWRISGALSRIRSKRDPARPLVWCHVSSAGEMLQAQPVLERLRKGGCQLALSVTSVSGLAWLDRFDAWPEMVWAGLLPFDFPRPMSRLMDALRPSAMLYVQADLWPNLVDQARRRGIPQVLIAARIDPDSRSRLGWPMRLLFGRLYRHIDAILAVTPADQERLERLVPGHPRLEVGGDPGIDTALARIARADPPALFPPSQSNGAPCLVAGSTWPEDEALLLPALTEALDGNKNASAVIAPHEPEEPHLLRLESALAAFGTARLSAVESGQALENYRVVLVDVLGRLAGLYALGTVAYVGGGFSTGVHNLAEPAAAGKPVVFGPRYRKSAVAQALLEAGAGKSVADGAGLRSALLTHFADPALSQEQGAAARAAVESMACAAARCHKVILDVAPALRPAAQPAAP